MKLHEYPDDFNELIPIVASWKGIPDDAVYRDYYIVMMLMKLSESEYADSCVFKGGTSLSKCYPESIERFSEDIDLTYIPEVELSNKQYDKALKQIEKIMSQGGRLEKIGSERNDRNKSSFVWFDDDGHEHGKIKLEIGSSVRPDPYDKKPLRTYIQEYLEKTNHQKEIEKYELKEICVNTLGIERTFLDKVMSVKRHAICGTLSQKVRHIYDVARLYEMPEIKGFLENRDELKRLVRLTKDTDSFYLERRGIAEEYDPVGAYDFDSWNERLDNTIRKRYESLHEDLLYTNERQDFAKALKTFEELDAVFKLVGE